MPILWARWSCLANTHKLIINTFGPGAKSIGYASLVCVCLFYFSGRAAKKSSIAETSGKQPERFRLLLLLFFEAQLISKAPMANMLACLVWSSGPPNLQSPPKTEPEFSGPSFTGLRLWSTHPKGSAACTRNNKAIIKGNPGQRSVCVFSEEVGGLTTS